MIRVLHHEKLKPRPQDFILVPHPVLMQDARTTLLEIKSMKDDVNIDKCS